MQHWGALIILLPMTWVMLSLLLRMHMYISCWASYILHHVQRFSLIAVGNGVEVEKRKDKRSDGGKEEEIQGNQYPTIQYLNKTHVCLKSPYPVENLRNRSRFFLSESWHRVMFGAQEQLWSDVYPDTTIDPDGIRTLNPLTISRECYPLSNGCSYPQLSLLFFI